MMFCEGSISGAFDCTIRLNYLKFVKCLRVSQRGWVKGRQPCLALIDTLRQTRNVTMVTTYVRFTDEEYAGMDAGTHRTLNLPTFSILPSFLRNAPLTGVNCSEAPVTSEYL